MAMGGPEDASHRLARRREVQTGATGRAVEVKAHESGRARANRHAGRGSGAGVRVVVRALHHAHGAVRRAALAARHNACIGGHLGRCAGDLCTRWCAQSHTSKNPSGCDVALFGHSSC